MLNKYHSPQQRARSNKPKGRVRNPLRVSGYTRHVKTFECSVRGCEEKGIDPHHIRKGIPDEDKGGMGEQPHDKWAVPLCRVHHTEYHNIGHDTFEAKHGLNLHDLACWLWSRWSGRRAYELKRKKGHEN